ncbi:MAG: hypothetical protein ACJASY_002399 [Halioglobus sp.]|jgi:uncharacterized protein YhhL (DUF1145 family)
MSRGKIGALVFYAILAVLAITQAGTQIGTVVNWIIVALVAVHAVEVVVFYKLCRDSQGSLFRHLINVFIFGYFHTQELKANAA